MTFSEKSLKTLELPTILGMLANEAMSEGAKQAALELTPSGDFHVTQRLLQETGSAKNMMVLNGSPPFGGVKDIGASLVRAEAGGCLNTTELLAAAAVLRAAEIEADTILFAKAVNYIYNRDPAKVSDEPLYKYAYLSYGEILEKGLTAIDITATAFALANDLTITVFGMNDPRNIIKAATGEVQGTIIHGGESVILPE